jgi:hypothetical protein
MAVFGQCSLMSLRSIHPIKLHNDSLRRPRASSWVKEAQNQKTVFPKIFIFHSFFVFSLSGLLSFQYVDREG